jgi:cytochrome c peroxidase
MRFAFFICLKSCICGLFIASVIPYESCVRPSVSPVQVAQNEQAVLGRYLFFDKRLSANGTRSCANCHDPYFAFSDGYRRSPGAFADPTLRNAPSLLNVVYMPTLNWANPDITNFETQMLRPLFNQNPPEMGLFWPKYNQHPVPHSALLLDSVLQRLQKDTLYKRLIARAYPAHKGPWQPDHFFAAIGAFERSLVSFNSPYDAFMKGDKKALPHSALRGKDLFFSSKLGCSVCHSGHLLSDGRMYNIGLYNIANTGAYPAEDQGLYNITKQTDDKGKFRTPSLRNVALTAPYFHDGSIDRLEEVIRLFAAGGQHILSGPNAGDGRKSPCKTPLIKPFSLSPSEEKDLLRFLECLSDTTFRQNPWFRNPFDLN